MKQNLFKELALKSAIITAALFVALLVGAILFAIAGANPLKAYTEMLTRPLEGKFGLTEIMVRAAPLMIVALGIAISFRSGILNIGGEGQIMIVAVSGAFIALSLPEFPWIILLPLDLAIQREQMKDTPFFCSRWIGGLTVWI